jgi:hypothetical protein
MTAVRTTTLLLPFCPWGGTSCRSPRSISLKGYVMRMARLQATSPCALRMAPAMHWCTGCSDCSSSSENVIYYIPAELADLGGCDSGVYVLRLLSNAVYCLRLRSEAVAADDRCGHHRKCAVSSLIVSISTALSILNYVNWVRSVFNSADRPELWN